MGNPILRGLHDGCSHTDAGSLRVTYLDGCIPISFLKVVIQAIPISPAVVPYGRVSLSMVEVSHGTKITHLHLSVGVSVRMRSTVLSGSTGKVVWRHLDRQSDELPVILVPHHVHG